MNKQTFKKLCEQKGLDAETVAYNCGHRIEDLKLYKGEIFKPCYFVGGYPKYEFIAKYEIKLEDCI